MPGLVHLPKASIQRSLSSWPVGVGRQFDAGMAEIMPSKLTIGSPAIWSGVMRVRAEFAFAARLMQRLVERASDTVPPAQVV